MGTDELNKWFYKGFDPSFLYHKTQAISFVLCDLTSYERWRQQQSAQDNPFPWNPSLHFVPALRCELYFTAVHQFEGFLALLLAIFQPQPHWVYLTTYGPGEMRDAAQRLLDGRLEELTGSCYTDKRRFIMATLYGDMMSEDEMVRSRWEENLDNAYWLVECMAHHYLDGLDAYNAYKHGIRVVAGEVNSFTEHGFLHIADDGVAYLKIDGAQVHEVTREFFPKESLYFLSVMCRMQETIRETRLSNLEPEARVGVKVRMHDFLDIPHEQLREWAQKQEFSIQR